MVTFAHAAPDCAEIMWNEQHWTLVSMPITSTRAQWDEGLLTVRQFNDLLRVLPPIPQPGQNGAAGQAIARRAASPSRPLAPRPAELPAGRTDAPPARGDVGRYTQQRPPVRNGRQSPHYQR
jgi:hypothetical protein